MFVEYSGATVSPSPVFVVLDSVQNPIPAVLVTFSIDTLGSVITGDKRFTDSLGRVAPTSWTVGKALHGYLLTASTGSLTAMYAVQVNSGPVTTIVPAAGNNQQGGVGLIASTTPTVTALDSAGRPVPSLAVTWSDGALGRVRCSSTTDVRGKASLAPCQWRFGDSPGTDTLYATAGTDTAMLTAKVLEAPASLVFLAPAPNVAISKVDSATITAKVQLRLTSGQPAAGYSLEFYGGRESISQPAVTDASGIATARFSLF